MQVVSKTQRAFHDDVQQEQSELFPVRDLNRNSINESPKENNITNLA